MACWRQARGWAGNNIYLYLHTIFHVCPNHALFLIHSISKHLQFSQLISISFAWPDLAERNVRQLNAAECFNSLIKADISSLRGLSVHNLKILKRCKKLCFVPWQAIWNVQALFCEKGLTKSPSEQGDGSFVGHWNKARACKIASWELFCQSDSLSTFWKEGPDGPYLISVMNHKVFIVLVSSLCAEQHET